jgi:hypothetical protein
MATRLAGADGRGPSRCRDFMRTLPFVDRWSVTWSVAVPFEPAGVGNSRQIKISGVNADLVSSTG